MIALSDDSSPATPRVGRVQLVVAGGALVAIGLALALRVTHQGNQPVGLPAPLNTVQTWEVPLILLLLLGGGWLVTGLAGNLVRREFGSDLLAGLSIVTSIIMGEYLAGAIVVLMLSGGEALEAMAVGRASSVLAALARRMPAVVHRLRQGQIDDCALGDIVVGDELQVFPHEICPVDGIVLSGHGWMDEAYLTGEPFRVPKAPGTTVLSGAVNGDSALTIRAEKRAVDSRYAKIMAVMRESEQRRPRMRRLADQLGAWYTPLALALALVAAWYSGDARRFLAVLVVATPCPLLIAIPVAILGAVSLSARRGIIVRDPAVLEMVGQCRIAIFDKTGTLTYGRPVLMQIQPLGGYAELDILRCSAALERYSRHPLALAITDAAEHRAGDVPTAEHVQERAGRGIEGRVSGRMVRITGRKELRNASAALAERLPPALGGLECVVLLDEQPAGVLHFRDQPREDGRKFIDHLTTLHRFQRVLLVSGDRNSEVDFLAREVGILEVFAEQSPEQKVELVRHLTQKEKTLFVGDGINDAPALAAATVGLAFGQNSDVTSEAARAVILDATLRRVDEFLHIGARLRRVALQSALGGMALSLLGMAVAAAGWLPPVAGALFQEVIDVIAVLNALRVAVPPRLLTDY